MCERCEDYKRTVNLLADLSLYVNRDDADLEFADITGYALAASLPAAQGGDGFPPAPGQER